MGFRSIIKRLDFAERLIRRNPLYYTRAIRLFDHLETLSLSERKSWTQQKLAKILNLAAQTEYGKRVHATSDIASWPVLEKEQVRKAPKDFLTVPPWGTSHATTSGTTGTPLQLYRSLRSVAIEQAAIDRLLMRKGVDPKTYRAAVLRGDDIKDPSDRRPPFWAYHANGRRLVFSSNHLNLETLPFFVEEIKKFKPHVLHAYPTILDSFCNLLKRANLHLEIPITICSSEVLPVESWQRCASTLRSQVIDYYGQAERVSFAYAFEPESYRFLPGYSYNELHPVEENPGTYEIVCTTLWNTAMPLIRFKTGDFVQLEPNADLEAICYGTETFAGVLGRTGDFLVAPDGARLMGIDHIPRGVQHVVRMQVIQETPEMIRILVVPEPGFSDSDRQTIDRNCKLKLPPPMQWQIQLVEDLERTSSGKAPFVIRR